MLCLFALAPASPLISFAAFFYFLVCVPILRWTTIFLYKPRFDIGGKRFPFCFDMLVSGMLVGNILLVAMMVLRRAFGPACAAFLPLVPIVAYRVILRRRYMKAFDDVALLQTSLLDGWDTNEETNVAKREEFRQFLVDCHKAAYVPVCIASGEGTMITSEPAVVVPLEMDVEDTNDDDMTSVHGGGSVSMYSHTQGEHGAASSVQGGCGSVSGKATNQLYAPYKPQQQPGRIMRRASCSFQGPPAVMIPVVQLQERKLQGLPTNNLPSADTVQASPRKPKQNSSRRLHPHLVSPSSSGKRRHRHSTSFDGHNLPYVSTSPQQKYPEASPTRRRKPLKVERHPQTTAPSLHDSVGS